jgi:AcrR family transcriptional regulator
LLKTALETFAAYGYDGASINTILKHAGMSKGQFYYHFKTKQDLYFALVEVVIARKQAYLAEVMTPADYDADIFTILRSQIRHGLEFARAHPAIERFAQSFLRERGSAIYDLLMDRYDFERNDGLNQLVERAYHRGEFRAGVTLAFAQRMIGYLFTHVAEMTDLTEADSMDASLDQLITFMKSGLGPAEE